MNHCIFHRLARLLQDKEEGEFFEKTILHSDDVKESYRKTECNDTDRNRESRMPARNRALVSAGKLGDVYLYSGVTALFQVDRRRRDGNDRENTICFETSGN